MRYLARYQDFPYRKGVKATSLVLSSREAPLSADNNCLASYSVALSEEPGITEPPMYVPHEPRTLPRLVGQASAARLCEWYQHRGRRESAPLSRVSLAEPFMAGRQVREGKGSCRWYPCHPVYARCMCCTTSHLWYTIRTRCRHLHQATTSC